MIPIDQLLYLLWSQSTNISIMYVANDSLRSSASITSSSSDGSSSFSESEDSSMDDNLRNTASSSNFDVNEYDCAADQRCDTSSSPDFKSGRDDGSDAW